MGMGAVGSNDCNYVYPLCVCLAYYYASWEWLDRRRMQKTYTLWRSLSDVLPPLFESQASL